MELPYASLYALSNICSFSYTKPADQMIALRNGFEIDLFLNKPPGSSCGHEIPVA